MSSTTSKQYTPTATARPSWREREAQKERQQREAVARAAEEARQTKIAKTETNFPSTMQPIQTMRVHGGPAGKFAELATKWQVEEQIKRELENYRKASNDRERAVIRDSVIFLRNRRTRDDDSYESEDEEEERVVETLDERFPPHGPRGTFTPPDNEGWRLVTRKTRRQPRELTQAQLAQKYRDEFYGGDAEDEAEVNDDYDDRAQRRQFY
jgi:hypothetical protein